MSLVNRSCLLERVDLTSLEFIVPTLTLATLNVAVILGNMLVVMAVLTSPKLRSVTNTFIVSLAVADLLVGILVLPFSNANETMRYWVFGTVWCSVWLAIDVWTCTASILNLCAISLDRYLAISKPFKYHDLMSQRRARYLVVVVWVISFVICCPPLIGWKGGNGAYNVSESVSNFTQSSIEHINITDSPLYMNVQNITQADTFLPNYGLIDECPKADYPVCGLTADPGYIVYSALGSFFIPAFIMSFFYYKIYRTAASSTAALKKGMLTMKTSSDCGTNNDNSVTLRVHRGGGSRMNLISPVSNSVNSKRKSSIHYGRSSLKHSSKPKTIERSSSRHSIKSNNIDRSSLGEYIKQTSLEANTKQTQEDNITESNCDSPLLTDENTTKNGAPTRNNDCNEDDAEPNDNISPSLQQSQNGSSSKAIQIRNEHANTMRKFGRKNIRSQLRKLNKEKKAAKTVGIIVGCFILCWLPFFTVYLVGAFCEDCTPPLMFSVFFWLGYCNSAVNPCIYALFSKDFRYAFRNLLVCKCKQQPSSIWHFLYTLRVNMSTAQNSTGSNSNSEEHE